MTEATQGANDLDLELDSLPAAPSGEKKAATIPSKYEGKSVEDLINMHQNAERALSRQGNEVSDLRRIADALIVGSQNLNNATKKEQPKPVTVEALLDNPDKALNEALNGSAIAQQIAAQSDRLAGIENQITHREFVSAHPTYQDDAADPEFLKWVQRNPIRSQLARQADGHDYKAAKSLFDMWTEFKEIAKPGESVQATREQKLNQVKTVRNAASEGRVAPKYSRAKLMALRMRVQDGDPEAKAKWEDPTFQADLVNAYAEGRVK